MVSARGQPCPEGCSSRLCSPGSRTAQGVGVCSIGLCPPGSSTARGMGCCSIWLCPSGSSTYLVGWGAVLVCNHLKAALPWLWGCCTGLCPQEGCAPKELGAALPGCFYEVAPQLRGRGSGLELVSVHLQAALHTWYGAAVLCCVHQGVALPRGWGGVVQYRAGSARGQH